MSAQAGQANIRALCLHLSMILPIVKTSSSAANSHMHLSASSPVLSYTSTGKRCHSTDICCSRTLLHTDGFGCGDSVRVQQLQRVQIVQLGFRCEIRPACPIPIVVNPTQIAVGINCILEPGWFACGCSTSFDDQVLSSAAQTSRQPDRPRLKAR